MGESDQKAVGSASMSVKDNGGIRKNYIFIFHQDEADQYRLY